MAETRFVVSWRDRAVTRFLLSDVLCEQIDLQRRLQRGEDDT